MRAHPIPLQMATTGGKRWGREGCGVLEHWCKHVIGNSKILLSKRNPGFVFLRKGKIPALGHHFWRLNACGLETMGEGRRAWCSKPPRMWRSKVSESTPQMKHRRRGTPGARRGEGRYCVFDCWLWLFVCLFVCAYLLLFEI